MSDDEFAEHKKGLEKRWTEQPKNLKEEASRYWAEIDSGGFDFLRREFPSGSGILGSNAVY